MIKPRKFSLLSLFLIIALVMNLAIAASAQDLNSNFVRNKPSPNDSLENSDKLSAELLMELSDMAKSEDNTTVRVIVQTRGTQDRLCEKIQVQGGHLTSALPDRGYDPYGHGRHFAGVAAGSSSASIQSGSQASSSFTLYQGIVFTGGRLVTSGRLLTSRLLTRDGRLLTGRLMITDGWFFDSNLEMWVNASVAQPVWVANLLDRSQMSSSSVFGTQAASEVVRVQGEDTRGRELPGITSENHPLFPRGNK